MVLRGFHGFQGYAEPEGLGGSKVKVAAPLTNLCSDAGVGRMSGCLDIWYLGGFRWFCLDLGGFTWISCIPGTQSLSPCDPDKRRAATPLTNLCSDAGVGRMPGCLDFMYPRDTKFVAL